MSGSGRKRSFGERARGICCRPALSDSRKYGYGTGEGPLQRKVDLEPRCSMSDLRPIMSFWLKLMAHQSRHSRESRPSRPLCRLPDSRGRSFETSLREHPAVDRRTAAAPGHVVSIRRQASRVRQQPWETCVLMTGNSSQIDLLRGTGNLRRPSAADGDASHLKNAAGGGNLGSTEPASDESRLIVTIGPRRVFSTTESSAAIRRTR